MRYQLSDIIEMDRLQKLLDHLYAATGIPSGIIDVDGAVLIASGWRNICMKYHRVNPITNKRCIENDTCIYSKIKEGQRYVVSKCKNGLVDIGSPIIVDGYHLATVFQGQFFFEEPNIDFFEKQAEKVGFDKKKYLEEIKNVPVISEKQIKNSVLFLTDFAEFIADMGYSRIKLKEAYNELKQSNEEITALYQQLTAAEEELREQYDVLKKNNNLLEESEQRYRLVVDGANDVIWDLDLRNNKVFVSNKIQEILKVQPCAIQKITDFLQFVYAEDRERITERFNEYIKFKSEYHDEYKVVSRDGNIRWLLSKGKILRDSNNNPIRIAGSFRDITDKKLYEKRIEKMAYHDTLTGLYNRNQSIIEIDKKLNNMEASKQGSMAVILMDIDNFKNINDVYGHQTGDYILKQVSERMINSAKKNEIFTRFGGDEFIILLYDYTDIKDIENRAEEILNEFINPFHFKTKEFFITASMGIVINSSEKTTYDEILKNADIAMYNAKEKGKNTYCFFEKSMYENNIKKLVIEEELSEAIKKDEFFLVYQPKINIKLNKVEGFEALIRWKHPKKGIIYPGEFIPIAEQNGLIEKIDFWVLGEVFRKIMYWDDKGIDMGVISLNVSPNQLKDEKIVDKVKELIKENPVNTSRIQIEITENMFIESFQDAKDIIFQLKKLGFKISLDDFGKGYSSLNYLKWLPIDVLKIDKIFVDGINNDQYELIDLIISLAHRLQLKIVAEGVENYNQYRYLKENDCDIIQGYYMAKPMSLDDAEGFILNYDNTL